MFESHYQSFEDRTDPSQGGPRATALRRELKRLGVDGFLVPRADQHQNEYVAASDERLAWLTGFTGSAGLAIVLEDRAAIFVDGRYVLAVETEVDISIFTPVATATTSPESWLGAHLKRGARLGYDPWLHTPNAIERLAKCVAAAGAELVAIEPNPIDRLWDDRPPMPLGKVSLHAAKYAGEPASRKLTRAARALGTADTLLVSDPHSVAWLFNIRGADVSHTPLPLAYALVSKQTRPRLYLDARKLDGAVRDRLGKLAEIEAPDRLVPDLEKLGRDKSRVLFDSATVAAKLTSVVEAAGGSCDIGRDPIALMKARKNSRVRAEPMCGTRSRWCVFSTGSHRARREAVSPKSERPKRSKPSAARAVN
jgi:Xaa-Pro aminopeptidase